MVIATGDIMKNITNSKLPNGDTFMEGLAVTYMEMLKAKKIDDVLNRCVKYYIDCTKWRRHLSYDEAKHIIETAEQELKEAKQNEEIYY